MIDIGDKDGRLAAFADGELDQAESAAVEAELAANPDARAILAIHQETTALLKAAFPESRFAGDPLPARAIRRPAPRTAAPRYGWAIAASLLLGLIGYGAGVKWPVPLVSEHSRLMSEIAEYHSVYSRETVHLVEVPASQADHLKMWLGKRVNLALVIPDLTEAGLTFAGARMVVVEGAPAAALMYTRKEGLPIALCIFNQEGPSDSLRLDQRDDVSLASWSRGQHTFVVVGEADSDLVRDVAKRVQKQI